ncbi:hypothetical protein AB6D11_06250 [Vibrio splendidus]
MNIDISLIKDTLETVITQKSLSEMPASSRSSIRNTVMEHFLNDNTNLLEHETVRALIDNHLTNISQSKLDNKYPPKGDNVFDELDALTQFISSPVNQDPFKGKFSSVMKRRPHAMAMKSQGIAKGHLESAVIDLLNKQTQPGVEFLATKLFMTEDDGSTRTVTGHVHTSLARVLDSGEKPSGIELIDSKFLLVRFDEYCYEVPLSKPIEHYPVLTKAFDQVKSSRNISDEQTQAYEIDKDVDFILSELMRYGAYLFGKEAMSDYVNNANSLCDIAYSQLEGVTYQDEIENQIVSLSKEGSGKYFADYLAKHIGYIFQTENNLKTQATQRRQSIIDGGDDFNSIIAEFDARENNVVSLSEQGDELGFRREYNKLSSIEKAVIDNKLTKKNIGLNYPRQ